MYFIYLFTYIRYMRCMDINIKPWQLLGNYINLFFGYVNAISFVQRIYEQSVINNNILSFTVQVCSHVDKTHLFSKPTHVNNTFIKPTWSARFPVCIKSNLSSFELPAVKAVNASSPQNVKDTHT